MDTAAATTRFSLDGFHPNNRGQAVLTNLFIEAINSQLDLTGGDALVPVPTEGALGWDPTYPEPPTRSNLASLLD